MRRSHLTKWGPKSEERSTSCSRFQYSPLLDSGVFTLYIVHLQTVRFAVNHPYDCGWMQLAASISTESLTRDSKPGCTHVEREAKADTETL
eukprot:1243720-Amphidinium_carterae.1